MKRLLQGLYVCLVVVESRGKVNNLQEFHEYNYETYLLILYLFPFLGVNTTIHLFLAHSAQLIFLNDCTGFAQKAEKALETKNKTTRDNRLHLSRTTNQGANYKYFRRIFYRLKLQICTFLLSRTSFTSLVCLFSIVSRHD